MWIEYLGIFILTFTSVLGIITIINFFVEKNYKYKPKKYVKMFMLVDKRTDEIELEIREILNENEYPLVVIDNGIVGEDKEKLELLERYNPNLKIIKLEALIDYLKETF